MSNTMVSTSPAARMGRVLRSLWNADGRQIIYYFGRLGIDEKLAYTLTKGLRFVRHPTEYLKRRQALSLIPREKKLAGLMSRKTGYGKIASDAIPELKPVIELVRRLRDERATNSPLPGERFRATILGPGDLHTYPELREFALSYPLVQIASEYMGSVPVLATVQGWWTPSNDMLESSQLFHVDANDQRTVKFFFNIENVGEKDGPFTFIPADISARVLKSVKTPNGRIEDEEIFRYCKPSDVIEAVGPPGAGFVVDGCRCLHFGARARGGSRLVLLVEFYSYFSPKDPAFAVEPSDDWYRGDPLRRIALGLH